MPSPTLPVQAVVFDLDGLLVNTEQLYPLAAHELLGRRGRQFTPDLHQQMMGRPATAALAVLKDMHALPESLEELIDESATIFRGLLDDRLDLMPGVPELLARIEQAGLPKAVATSSGRGFAEEILGRMGLIERFRFLLCAEDVTRGKPDPEVYLKAADRIGVTPTRMMVLEDSVNGYRAGIAAGAVVIAVPGEHNAGQSYPEAHRVLASLADARLDDLWTG